MISSEIINNECIFKIDTDIYNDTVIDKVLYWYSADYVIYRKKDTDSSVETIILEAKTSSSEKQIYNLIADFNEKLVDYKNRQRALEETKTLRELFFAKAFSNNDNFIVFDFNE